MVRSLEKLKRRSAPKVRSGCKTWIRRVKCDETRPNCTNCESTGRVCDGYPASNQFRAVTFQSNDKVVASSSSTLQLVTCERNKLNRRNQSSGSDDSAVELITPLRQPGILPGSSQEQNFFTIFRENHAPTLGGYFDSDFWSIQLPRVAHSEPAIYHAIIAIVALDHGMIYSEAVQSENKVLSLCHYNKAIRFVKYQLQKAGTSKHVILLTCLLFVCLEFKRGNTEAALSHLQSGLGILHSQDSGNDSPKLSATNKSLTHAFSRLSIQSLLAGRQSPYGYHQTLEASYPTQTSFSNIEEARNSLVKLFIESLTPIGADFNLRAGFATPRLEQSRRATLISQLHHWNSQIGLLMRNNSISLTPQDLRRISLLRVQNLVALIWNSTTIPPSDGSSVELASDSYTRIFEMIMSLALFIVDNQRTHISTGSSGSANSSTTSATPVDNPTTWHSPPTFSLETGLIFALYFVAIKCRSPTIRRQAAYLLTRVEPRREGMWDACVLDIISRYVIEFEERSCIGPVTEERGTWPADNSRVHAIDIVPRCDYGRRVQRVTFVWMPTGMEGGYVEWAEDIKF